MGTKQAVDFTNLKTWQAVDSFEHYIELSRRTRAEYGEHMTRLVLAGGLAGESGEIADYMKKVVGHGHPLDLDLLADEVGDLWWYVAWVIDFFKLDWRVVHARGQSRNGGPALAKLLDEPAGEALLKVAVELASHASDLALCIVDGADADERNLVFVAASLFALNTVVNANNTRPAAPDTLGRDYLYLTLERNINKLRMRYPDKFSTEASLARVDAQASQPK